MKLILNIFLCILIFFIPYNCSAEQIKGGLWKTNSYEKKVNRVGHKILRTNEITELITFRVPPRETKKSKVNASSNDKDGIITVERPLLRVIENDDELAGILSHEIAHVLKRHGFRGSLKRGFAKTVLFTPLIIGDVALGMIGCPLPILTTGGGVFVNNVTNSAGQKYEFEADEMAVDIMVKAGYNPVCYQEILSRITSDGYNLNMYRTHPKGSIRISKIHAKIAEEYPEFLEKSIPKENTVKMEEKTIPVNNKNK